MVAGFDHGEWIILIQYCKRGSSTVGVSVDKPVQFSKEFFKILESNPANLLAFAFKKACGFVYISLAKMENFAQLISEW